MASGTLPRQGFGGKHAIVIGASTTGLISAAIAARHFRHVTVLDRDRLPAEPVWRKGTPQSRHAHLLLRAGQNTFDRYLSGFTADLLARGARQLDMAGDIASHHSGGWRRRFQSGITILSQSKGLLEWSLRRRVNRLRNVEIRDCAGVKELLSGQARITGVRLEEGETLEADLVIDAMGRNSHTPDWLERGGFGRVSVTELAVDVGYSTQVFRPPSGNRTWQGLLVHPRHPDTRCAALLPIEDGQWLTTLAGWRGDHPPADLDGFLEWSRGLAAPDLYQSIRDAEPLGPARQWRFASNLRRHYERLRNMPDGLVVLGDAAASTNPVYAQGMSHGALGAELLDGLLLSQRSDAGEGNVAGLSRRFQDRYARLTDDCWLTSTAEDRSSLDAQNGRFSVVRLVSWYLGQVNELTWHDEGAARKFISVMHLLRPPDSLLRPALLLRVLAGGLRARSVQPACSRRAALERRAAAEAARGTPSSTTVHEE